METAAIILAAGAGTRMKSKKPKVVHEVLGRPLVRWVVEAAKEAGTDRVVTVVGHMRDQVIPLVEGDTEVVVQEAQRGTADAVLAAADGKPPTGELIAEVMLSDANCHTPPLRPYMEGGERSDMPYINFYLDYFAQGRPAFVPVEYMDFRRAVELVRRGASGAEFPGPGGDRRAAARPRGRGTGSLQQLPHPRTGCLFHLAGPLQRRFHDLRKRFPRQDQAPDRRRAIPV